MGTMRLMVGVFLFVGTGMLVAAGFGYQHTKKFLEKASTAEGTVIEHSRHSINDNKNRSAPVYYPVVQYKTAEGKAEEFISSTGSNPPDYDVGDKVKVFYDPLKPKHAKINYFVDIWLLPLILGFIGTIFTTLGSLFWYFFLRLAPPTSLRLSAKT